MVSSLASPPGPCAGDFNPVRDAAVATGLGAERKKGPDFVSQSRPAELTYAPIGAQPKRSMASKGVPGVKAVEAQMDAARTANEARGKEAREVGAAVKPLQAPAPPPPIE